MSVARRWSYAATCAVLSCCALGCANECHLEQCDIRDEACQRAVLELTLCARGGDPVDVPVHVIDADAYTEEQVAQTEASEGAERAAREYAGLALLRLVSDELSPPDTTRINVERTAAFYSPEDKAITILDRGRALDELSVAMTLVHEYVHALQDAEHDLTAVDDAWGQTLDGALAVAAVVEGEAELYEARAAALALGHDLEDLDFERGYRELRASTRAGVSMLDDPFVQLYSYFAYAYGVTYVDAAVRHGGRAAVDDLFENPPASARQVIAGYGQPPPGGEPWVEKALDEEGLPMLGSSYVFVDSWHTGSYALWVFLNRWLEEDIHDPAAFEPLLHLRNDVLSVFDRGDGSVVAAWRLRFSSPEYALVFIDQLQDAGFDRHGRLEAYQSWVEDRDAFVVAGRDAITALPDFTELAWGPLP